MKNILRWALCQTFGKAKGAALTEALMAGELGEEIRTIDEGEVALLLSHAASAIRIARKSGR